MLSTGLRHSNEHDCSQSLIHRLSYNYCTSFRTASSGDYEMVGLFYFHRYFDGIPPRILYTKDLSQYIRTLLSVICLEKAIYGIYCIINCPPNQRAFHLGRLL